jgi:hypothetical protein
MPHDAKGEVIKDGDIVTLKAKVTNVASVENYCNCTYTIIKPDSIKEDEYIPSFTANTRLSTKS